MSDRSVRARFGGDSSLKLRGGVVLCIGEAIQGEGPGSGKGKGFAVCPWCLDRYERALRLRPVDTWLVKRFMKYAWEFGGEVYPSLHSIERQALISRVSVQGHVRRLRELGYVLLLSEGEGRDLRRRYDVSGIYAALALCIVCDPRSKWAIRNGGPLDVSVARTLEHRGRSFDLDFSALLDLSAVDVGG